MSSSQPPLLQNATRDLARFAAETRDSEIPFAVVERVKLSFIDGLGVCLHGSTLPWTRKVSEVVQEEGGKGVASLWGNGHRASLTNAVLVNSTAGHAFEMDDIHTELIVHPNSLALPVALALAEANPSLSGRDIVTALILGYEVGLRIGNAATTSLFLNGFHPQGTSGAFVAAATAGRLLALDPSQMQHALGIAGSMGAGLMAAQEGAMVKRLHAGRAAQGGMLAALLAKRGFTGISDVVEAGYGGFLSSFSRSPNVQRLMEGLGKDWEAGKVGFEDVSQRYQYPLGTRRAAINSSEREPGGVTDQGNQCRLWSHDVRAHCLGIPSSRNHGSTDEHVLRPERDGTSRGRIGSRLFRRYDCGSGNPCVHTADQDCC